MTKYVIQYSLIFLFMITCLVAFANGEDSIIVKKKHSRKSLGVFYQAGKVLPSNSFINGKNALGEPIDHYQSISVQFAFETDGRKLWQQLYNYPSWGFGIYGFRFFNKDELGTPMAFYSFFNAPFFRYKKWSLNYNIGFGISYNWKPYHPTENPYNTAIGSLRTGFLDMGIHLNFQLGKYFDLQGGLTFTHFSNGAAKVPNFGLNSYAPRITLKYTFKGHPNKITREIIPKYKKQWEFILLFAYSKKQMAFDTLWTDTVKWFVPEDYRIYNLSTTVNYQISYKVKFGAGIDFGYDETYNSFITLENQQVIKQDGEGNKLSIGLYPSFELVIHKLSIIVQPGWYIYRYELSIPETTDDNHVIAPRRIPADSYQRIGIKYHIIDNLFLGFSLRAYDFDVADYFEWNIGYRILR